MFDATIDKAVDKFGAKLDGATDAFKEQLHITVEDVMERFDDLSYQMKLVVAASILLSIVDTILLFAILKKLG